MVYKVADIASEIQEKIAEFRNEMLDHSNRASEVEREMMFYLWKLNKQGLVPVDRIAKWLGISRQTVYNRWSNYDFDEQGQNNRDS